MNIEQQVTSLELAKKLKELGYPQEGLFWWDNREIGHEPKGLEWVINFVKSKKLGDEYGAVVAPTVAELGEILPVGHHTVKLSKGWAGIIGGGGARTLDYLTSEDSIVGEKVEANARAKMLIWLVENGHINFER